MRGIAALAAALLVLSAPGLLAHDVPDRVDIAVLLKPDHGRMQILARVPANALIDFLLPTQEGGNWVDLTNADAPAAEAARVWIADRLTVRQNGVALPAPRLLKVRLSRVNDPAFAAFETALPRVNGPPLSPDTLALQEQLTLDALLEVPIDSPTADFTCEPQFGRLGVLVYTTLTYLPPDGSVRRFYYEGDPPAFALNATLGASVRRFFSAGAWHYFGDPEYLLFTLCVALFSMRAAPLATFALVFAFAELIALLMARLWLPSSAWVAVASAALVAAATVLAGIEAIVAAGGQRIGLAAGAGAIAGAAIWSALQALEQFGGSHQLAAALAFSAGVVLSQFAALIVATVAVRLLLRLSRVARSVAVIAAALAIHIAWRHMLDRIAALTLVAAPPAGRQLMIWAAVAAVLIALLAWAQRAAVPGLRRPAFRASSRPAE